MAARRHRASKAMRARNAAAKKLLALALDMEEPLNEAREAVHALRLMGHGLTQLCGEDEAGALAATAWTACQRLDAVRQIWRGWHRITARIMARRYPA
jgi:hypothetical protein